jgi:hypothetical protein
MHVRRKQHRDQAVQELRGTPLYFAENRICYARQMRWRAKRQHRFVAALLILGVAIGLITVLLTDSVSTLMK